MVRIFAVGLFVDILWVLIFRTVPFSDFLYYHEIATQIAEGGQWGDTYTSVGYPIFLALFYKLLGSSIWVAQSVNIVLSTLNNLLVYFLLKRLSILEKYRKYLLLLFMLFPANVYYNSILASEILFTTGLLLVLSIYLSNCRFKYVWVGLLTGINTMIKPFFPAFFLAVFLVEWIIERKGLRSLKRAGIVLVVAFVVLSPWLYRNYKLLGEFSYVSNNGGVVLYINNNSQNDRGGWMPAEDVEDSVVKKPEYAEANTVQKNKMLSSAAKAWIADHPTEFLQLGFKRLYRTFLGPGDIDYAYYGITMAQPILLTLSIMSELVRVPLFFLGCLSVLGYSGHVLKSLVFSKRQGRRRLEKGKVTLLITFYMFAGVYFITEGQSRYAFPTVMILSCFAFWGVLWGVQKWVNRLEG